MFGPGRIKCADLPAPGPRTRRGETKLLGHSVVFEGILERRELQRRGNHERSQGRAIAVVSDLAMDVGSGRSKLCRLKIVVDFSGEQLKVIGHWSRRQAPLLKFSNWTGYTGCQEIHASVVVSIEALLDCP